MRMLLMTCAVAGVCAAAAEGQSQPQPRKPDAAVQALVGRLDLERYKATLKGLAQFGDRRQGTERNRKAVDWIEAQLKSYGCPTERLKYEYNPPPPKPGLISRSSNVPWQNSVERIARFVLAAK